MCSTAPAGGCMLNLYDLTYLQGMPSNPAAVTPCMPAARLTVLRWGVLLSQ